MTETFRETLLETAAQARQRDDYTIMEEGIPSAVLMENAARALAFRLEQELTPSDTVFILCGPGNNGQDGLAMLRVLREHGIPAQAWCPVPDTVQERILEKRGIPVVRQTARALQALQSADWIVDAMFGSGLSRPLESDWRQLAQAANAAGGSVFAVDVPSGLHGTTGPTGPDCVKADLTVCIGTRKKGTILPESLPFCGHTETVPIGLGDPQEPRDLYMLTEKKARACLPVRPLSGYKGTFGKALVIGGSARMHGAVFMCLDACFHAGIGLLSAAVPRCLETGLRSKFNEAMLIETAGTDDHISEEAIPGIVSAATGMDVITAGNGMGRQSGTAALVKALLETDQLLVLDADALYGLDPAWLDRDGVPVILTPHLGEFSRLTGLPAETIRQDPPGHAARFTLAHPDAVLVLKSEITCVSARGRTWVLERPDTRLAKGGSGDVLCGIITGLAGSQEPLEAALCGVWAHNRAAALSKKDPAAFTPKDLVENLSDVWKELRN